MPSEGPLRRRRPVSANVTFYFQVCDVNAAATYERPPPRLPLRCDNRLAFAIPAAAGMVIELFNLSAPEALYDMSHVHRNI